MPRGGARPGAGRKKAINDTGSKMNQNNFREFLNNLLIEIINSKVTDKLYVHEVEIDGKKEKLYSSCKNVFQCSFTNFDKYFGRAARAEFAKYIDIIELGNEGRYSRIALVADHISIYNYLKEQGLLDKLNRESDGIIPSWPDQVEWLIKRKKVVDWFKGIMGEHRLPHYNQMKMAHRHFGGKQVEREELQAWLNQAKGQQTWI